MSSARRADRARGAEGRQAAPARLAAMRRRQLLGAGLALIALPAIALPASAFADPGAALTIVAASDLKFALDEIVAAYRAAQPAARIEVIYGSSGKFATQIRQGAPFDLYFSADIAYPRELEREGLAAGPTRPYATGRIVLWSKRRDAAQLRLQDLADPALGRIAIANPRHAPYGRRAEEALRAAGVWAAVEPRLVQGENIAQTAQFVLSGNAAVGIIALSLALNPTLARQGGYTLIDDALHAPLEQGFILTRRAADKPAAARFAAFVEGEAARAIMRRYGFTLPGEGGR